jgi:hypothetical protein
LDQGQSVDTVTIPGIDPVFSYSISRGGVNSDGATTYVVVEVVPSIPSTTIDGSVPTPVYQTGVFPPLHFRVSHYLGFWRAETLVASGSGYTIFATDSGPITSEVVHCSQSGSSEVCVESDWYEATYTVAGFSTTYATIPSVFSGPGGLPFITTTFPATTQLTTSAASLTASSLLPSTSPAHSASTSSKGAIIGGVVASIIVILTIVAVVLFCLRKRRTDPNTAIVNEDVMAEQQPNLDTTPIVVRPPPITPSLSPPEARWSPSQTAEHLGAIDVPFNPYDMLQTSNLATGSENPRHTVDALPSSFTPPTLNPPFR